MNEEIKKITVELPLELHKDLKRLTISSGRTMRHHIIEAIIGIIKKDGLEKDIKQLQHKLYVLKYDSYEEEKDGQK